MTDGTNPQWTELTAREWLQAKPYVLGPFTRIPRPEIIEMLGLGGFDFAIVDLEHGPIAAQRMGVLASNCLMIGDTTVDIRAGKAAGAQTVGVLCGFGTEKELRNAGADLILSSPTELPGVLLRQKHLTGLKDL